MSKDPSDDPSGDESVLRPCEGAQEGTEQGDHRAEYEPGAPADDVGQRSHDLLNEVEWHAL